MRFRGGSDGRSFDFLPHRGNLCGAAPLPYYADDRYSWKAGTYVFEVRKLESIEELGKPWTWVGAFVTDKASGKRVSIAALEFPGKELTLGPELAAFVEFYGGKEPGSADRDSRAG